MTLRARVTAEIDALLLDPLVTQTPIPGVGVDGLVAYLAALHPTVPVTLIESVLPEILEAHARRARAAGDVYLQETELVLADLRRHQVTCGRESAPE
jgi:hypothetical protein